MMLNIERLETNQRMSKIVKHNGVVYLCGQVGSGDTVADQTTDCLSRIDALLKQAGTTKKDILQATIWLADATDFAEMNSIWDAWLPLGAAPARACGECKPTADHLKVEILITAAYSE